MKSLSWLWLLREIVAENAKKECEIVFGVTGFKVLMVSYLNESCMSPSGMSSGPHGQTSATAHEFNSTNMSNEVHNKSCSLHKSVYIALQRDHFVCFGSHSRSPVDPVLCNVTCPRNSAKEAKVERVAALLRKRQSNTASSCRTIGCKAWFQLDIWSLSCFGKVLKTCRCFFLTLYLHVDSSSGNHSDHTSITLDPNMLPTKYHRTIGVAALCSLCQ